MLPRCCSGLQRDVRGTELVAYSVSEKEITQHKLKVSRTDFNMVSVPVIRSR
jgi:hypothetical protein